MASLRALAIFLALAAVVAPYAEAAISCGTVVSTLNPCLAYLKSSGGQPSASCCAGVSSLNSAAKTTADRQTACGCLKQIAKSISTLNYGLAAALPGKCHVDVPYTISPSTDCSKVR